MITVQEFLIYGFIGLSAGYIAGRIGHYYINVWIGNPSWVPHHWIYGAVLIPVSSYFNTTILGLVILFFGVGHIISDFNDFLNMEFFSPDKDGKKRFWHID